MLNHKNAPDAIKLVDASVQKEFGINGWATNMAASGFFEKPQSYTELVMLLTIQEVWNRGWRNPNYKPPVPGHADLADTALEHNPRLRDLLNLIDDVDDRDRGTGGNKSLGSIGPGNFNTPTGQALLELWYGDPPANAPKPSEGYTRAEMEAAAMDGILEGFSLCQLVVTEALQQKRKDLEGKRR